MDSMKTTLLKKLCFSKLHLQYFYHMERLPDDIDVADDEDNVKNKDNFIVCCYWHLMVIWAIKLNFKEPL